MANFGLQFTSLAMHLSHHDGLVIIIIVIIIVIIILASLVFV
jgi:hypothetical protein